MENDYLTRIIKINYLNKSLKIPTIVVKDSQSFKNGELELFNFIIHSTLKSFEISLDDIISSSVELDIIARRVACYNLYTHCRTNIPRIARLLGMDKSSISRYIVWVKEFEDQSFYGGKKTKDLAREKLTEMKKDIKNYQKQLK